MRQDNISQVSLNQPCLVITPSSYDKRALTCTDPLALTNSLYNLSYLTSVSTHRIASVLAKDGGLQLIIHIIQRKSVDNPLDRFAYSAALTCLANIAIRGNQKLRRSLVDAGVVYVIIQLLTAFLAAFEKLQSKPKVPKYHHSYSVSSTPQSLSNINTEFFNDNTLLNDPSQLPQQNTLRTRITQQNNHLANHILAAREEESRNINSIAPPFDDINDTASPVIENHPNNHPMIRTVAFNENTNLPRFETILPLVPIVPFPQLPIPVSPSISHSTSPSIYSMDSPLSDTEKDEQPQDEVLFRVEDILLSIKLLAYLTKYHDIRKELHTTYVVNVFKLVEQLTSPTIGLLLVDVFSSPSTLTELRKWSLICMRNCFKKDQESGSLRRCGNLNCSNWENEPRQYSKCARCRRVSYCCKECQKESWGYHRNWCIKYEVVSEKPDEHGIPLSRE